MLYSCDQWRQIYDNRPYYLNTFAMEDCDTSLVLIAQSSLRVSFGSCVGSDRRILGWSAMAPTLTDFLATFCGIVELRSGSQGVGWLVLFRGAE